MPVKCPCGSGLDYSDCCELLHAGLVNESVFAQSAEQLMRSRYTAYAFNLENYLLQTWHHTTRPPTLDLLHEQKVNWLGLKIIGTEAGDTQDVTGKVEFIARYKIAGKATRLHEMSRFLKEDNRWYYLDGE